MSSTSPAAPGTSGGGRADHRHHRKPQGRARGAGAQGSRCRSRWAHPDGLIAHALTFREMLEQSDATGADLDFVYHTIGTGTALPGMLAAKLSLGHPVKFRSISILSYNDGDWMNPSVIVERTKAVLAILGAPVPDDATIRAEIDVDQRFIGEYYAVASPESSAAIRELARAEGVSSAPSTAARDSQDCSTMPAAGGSPWRQRRVPAHRRHRQPVRNPRSRRPHHRLRPQPISPTSITTQTPSIGGRRD